MVKKKSVKNHIVNGKKRNLLKNFACFYCFLLNG